MYAVSKTVDDVIDALADFLAPFVDGAEIVRAQQNRVPMPATPCVVLTELFEDDLSVPSVAYDPQAETQAIKGQTKIDVQIDFYAPNAGDFCKAVKGVWRTEYSASVFPDWVKPLYCDKGIQSPLITGEQQWESRWTLTVSLQYNPVVTVPQQYAGELTAGVINVDVKYPPN